MRIQIKDIQHTWLRKVVRAHLEDPKLPIRAVVSGISLTPLDGDPLVRPVDAVTCAIDEHEDTWRYMGSKLRGLKGARVSYAKMLRDKIRKAMLYRASIGFQLTPRSFKRILYQSRRRIKKTRFPQEILISLTNATSSRETDYDAEVWNNREYADWLHGRSTGFDTGSIKALWLRNLVEAHVQHPCAEIYGWPEDAETWYEDETIYRSEMWTAHYVGVYERPDKSAWFIAKAREDESWLVDNMLYDEIAGLIEKEMDETGTAVPEEGMEALVQTKLESLPIKDMILFTFSPC